MRGRLLHESRSVVSTRLTPTSECPERAPLGITIESRLERKEIRCGPNNDECLRICQIWLINKLPRQDLKRNAATDWRWRIFYLAEPVGAYIYYLLTDVAPLGFDSCQNAHINTTFLSR